MYIGADGGVEEGFGGWREGAGGMEKKAVEVVGGVGRDVFEEEGFGVGEFVVAEEGGEEREEERRGGGGVVVLERESVGNM